jgi:hypothetical protein
MPLFAGQSREQLRQKFREAWRKFTAAQTLEPLEAQIAAVVAEHPEYQTLIESPEALTVEFSPEAGQHNPFLHMSLHLAIREQVATDRPPGIARIYRDLAARMDDAHAAEHALLERLAETLWAAQRAGRMPDEQHYLERLRTL